MASIIPTTTADLLTPLLSQLRQWLDTGTTNRFVIPVPVAQATTTLNEHQLRMALVGWPIRIEWGLDNEAVTLTFLGDRTERAPIAAPPTEGRKDDQAKVRIELVAPEFILGTADVLTFGATKYGDRNWEKGMKWSRCFGAMMRHMWCWWGAKQVATKTNFLLGDLDMETGRSHLWHASCCLMFLVAYEERGIGEDDRAGA